MSDERRTVDIEVKNLSYQPGGVERPILSDISYTFLQGHMTALLGPNGSGKTTLLRHFLLQIKSPEGAVLLRGKDSLSYSPKERSQIIFGNCRSIINRQVVARDKTLRQQKNIGTVLFCV